MRFVSYPSGRDEADQIAAKIAEEVRGGRRRPRDFAVFYRTNALSRQFEFAFREAGIPYQMINGLEFYHRKEIKDVLGYLLLLNNPRDDIAFLRVVNTPPRGIGKTSLERLAGHASRHGLTLFEAARECGLIETLPKKAAVSIAKFVSLFDRLGEAALRPVEEILALVLSESGYAEHLNRQRAGRRPGTAGQHPGVADRGAASSTSRIPARAAWKSFWSKSAWSTTPTPGKTPTTA